MSILKSSQRRLNNISDVLSSNLNDWSPCFSGFITYVIHVGLYVYMNKNHKVVTKNSSAGRAVPLQGIGQGFESPHLHQK